MVVAYFIPEIGSAAHIYFDLAKAFVKKGHEVEVITSYPRNFNLNQNDARKEFLKDEEIEGVMVHRCKHPANRDNIIVRGLEHFFIPIYYYRKYKSLKSKFDFCLIYIPPLPLYYLAKAIKKYDGTPSVLNYQDFHPKELTDVGIMKNPLLIKIMEHIERVSYKNADFITVISNLGIDYVVKRGADPKKVIHIYNGVLLSDIDTYSQVVDFKEKEKIEDKFLISYAGILSHFQRIDNILDVAKELTEYHDIIFYVIGDGSIKSHLEKRIEKEKIFNVKLLPFKPRAEYYNIINSSDVSLISLDERMETPCLPGKTINLMAAKKPIIAIAEKDTETAQVIVKSQSGIVVKPGNIDQFKDAILQLKNDKELRIKCGKNGRKYVEENMNLEICIDEYENILEILNEPSVQN